MNKNALLKWELIGGSLFIILLGTLLHDFYKWFPYPVLKAIAPINESVWEHFKLGIWPAFIFSLIEYSKIKPLPVNFWPARTLAIYLIPLIITVIFYSYTAIIGKTILIIDILTFVIAVIVAQIISYKIMTVSVLPGWVNLISYFALALLLILIILFSYYPPDLPIFQSP